MYWGDDWQFIGFIELLRLNVISILCVVLLIGVVLCIRAFRQDIEGCYDAPKKILELENTNENYIIFFTTYIIPLLDWDMSSPRDLIILATIMIVNGWLLIKTNLYYQNPILGMMGFNVYKATITAQGHQWNTVLVSKKKLEAEVVVSTHDLDGNETMMANKL